MAGGGWESVGTSGGQAGVACGDGAQAQARVREREQVGEHPGTSGVEGTSSKGPEWT